MQLFGRKEIFADVTEVTKDNVIQILRDALLVHTQNANDCTFLLNYEAGQQPLLRTKTYRADINAECVDNVANEIVEFKLSFNFGFPITFVQSGNKPVLNKDATSTEQLDAISELNRCYKVQGGDSKTQELARFIEICGVGYTYVDINADYEEGDSYFTVDVLDPRYTFVVKSSKIGHKPLMGVTFRVDNKGNRHFTCFTKDRRYEITNTYKVENGKEERTEYWGEAKRSGEINPFGVVPIIEYIRAHDRMGVFERQIPEMDNLNLLISDFTNDVDQNTQSIFHANDIQFPQDENGQTVTPQTGDWLQTFTTPDGKQPFVTPLAVAYDYPGMLNNIITRRSLILQKCNVPQRNDNSGGSTGVAMSDATGWSAAESAACKEAEIFEISKMQELKVVCKVLKKSPDLPSDSPLTKLKYSDCQPSIKRQKTYEMSTKANFMATLLSHGFYGEHVIKAANAFDDPNQVWIDSKKGIEDYQASVYNKDAENVGEGGSDEREPNADRTMQDQSDQEGNSPMIGGMNKNVD